MNPINVYLFWFSAIFSWISIRHSERLIERYFLPKTGHHVFTGWPIECERPACSHQRWIAFGTIQSCCHGDTETFNVLRGQLPGHYPARPSPITPTGRRGRGLNTITFHCWLVKTVQVAFSGTSSYTKVARTSEQCFGFAEFRLILSSAYFPVINGKLHESSLHRNSINHKANTSFKSLFQIWWDINSFFFFFFFYIKARQISRSSCCARSFQG